MSQPPVDPFMASCGAGGPLTFVLTAEGEVIGRPVLAQPFAIIGRDERCCLRLDDSRVSGRHAYVQVIAGRALCVDLGSQAGTRWGGRPRPWGWLGPGQGVEIGPFIVALASDAQTGGAAIPAGAELAPLDERADALCRLPGVSVAVSAGGQPGPRLRLNRLLTLVGRNETCRVRLRNPRVSYFHCALVATPQGPWVVDLLSREGTSLNDRPVRRAPVRDGSRLGVGPFQLRFAYLPAADDGTDGQRALVPALAPGPGGRDAERALPLASGPPDAAAGGQPAPGLLLGGGPAGGPLWRRAEVEATLLPLLHQVNLMHRQMFDQFQQTVLMMFRMFTSMHQDQTALVREELERLHEVTRELQALQGGGVAQPAAGPVTAAGAPALAGPVPALGGRSAVPRHGGPEATDDGGPAADARQAKGLGAAGPPAAGDGPPLPAGGGPSGENVHAWLSERVAALEQERQGRWQKVLRMVFGG